MTVDEPVRARPQHVPAHPGSSSEAVSLRMGSAARRDTGAELALRRALHSRGLRYRVTYPVPGQRRRTIDVAFTRAKVAVFVDGCFWHGCPEHGTMPRSNSEWWTTKLAANHARDRDTDRVLEAQGWTVVRVWEHESPDLAAMRVVDIVNTATTEDVRRAGSR